MTEIILELDLGNTAVKWRQLRDGLRIAGGRLDGGLFALKSHCIGVGRVRVASVASEQRNAELAACLQSWGLSYDFAVSQSRCGLVQNSYVDVARMGVDRWLAMVAAFHRLRSACMVVDVGTALTLDIVDDVGAHRGGYILPGPLMMEQALVGGTDRVRVSERLPVSVSPGINTDQCVQHGAWLACLASIKEVASMWVSAGNPQLAVVLTGGGGAAVAQLAGADSGWLLCEELVLDGLAPVLDGCGPHGVVI